MKKVIAAIVFLLMCGIVAYGQSSETFSSFVQGLTSATTPLNTADSVYLLQSGVSKQITQNNLFTYGSSLAAGSTTSRALANRESDIINVLDYGAICDGSTDDTIAIQAAITAASAHVSAHARGVTVFIPNAVCRTTNVLTITGAGGITLLGAGMGQSDIYLDTATLCTDVLRINVGASATMSNVTVRGLTFSRAQADECGYAINTNLLGASLFEDIYVYGNSTMGNGFYFFGVNSVHVLNVWVQSVIADCFNVLGDSGHHSTDLRVMQSRCDGGRYGYVIGDYVGGTYLYNNTFFEQSSTNVLQTSTDQAKVLDSYSIVGNDFDSTVDAMNFFYLKEGHIVGNRVGYMSGNCIFVKSGVDVNITGNNLIGYCGGTYGIALGDSSGGTAFVTRATVSGNIINGAHNGVFVGNSATDINVTGNTLAAQTSYGINVGNSSYSNVRVGPNTINASLATSGILRGGTDLGVVGGSYIDLSALSGTDSSGQIIGPQVTPASTTATCTTGRITWDATYIYICYSTDHWKRVATATW